MTWLPPLKQSAQASTGGFDPDEFLSEEEAFNPDEFLQAPISNEPGDLATRTRDGAPQSKRTGLFRSIAAGLAQGALKGGSDEFAGYLNQAKLKPGIGEVPNDQYRRGRNLVRSELEAARKENPVSTFMSEVAGDVGSDFLLQKVGVPVASSGYQALSGALTGLLGSDAEMTNDKSTPLSEATGLAQGVVGGVAGYALPKLGRRISDVATASPVSQWLLKKARLASADQGAADALKALKNQRSARGALGGDAGAVLNTVDHAERILKDSASVPEDIAWAKEFLSSDATRKVIDRARKNVRELAPKQLGKMLLSEDALDAANKAALPEAVDAATEATLSKPLKPIKDRLWKYGTRAIPGAVMAYIGNSVGGTEGAIGGFIAGQAAGAALGDPGTALKNIINNPAVRKATSEGVNSLMTKVPERLGKYAPVLVRALGRKSAPALSAEEEAKLQMLVESLRDSQ